MEGFEGWLNSDNVIKTEAEVYMTQCSQCNIPMSLLELKKYYLMQFIEPYFKPELEHVKTYLKGEYEVSELEHRVQEATHSYLDDGWEDEFDDEEEAYRETGRGEAESEVREEIQQDLLGRMKLTHQEYNEFIGQEVWDTINEVFNFLDA